METANLSQREQAIVKILENYHGLNRKQVEELIFATNGIEGVSFVGIKGYSSDKSENTELANQTVNIGASYKNMLSKDAVTFANIDLATIDVDKFDYSTIDTAGMTIEDYKTAVKNALPDALAELLQPKKAKDTSADVWLNKALVFNMNTMRLSVFGQSVSKTIEVKGDYKVVRSAPKTIAKKLIENACKSRTASLRRFALDNMIGSIRVNGETVELE